MKKISFILTLIAAMMFQNSYAQQGLNSQQKVKLLTQAYVYGYPLLTMKYTFDVSTNTELPDAVKGRSPKNQLAALYPFPKAGFTAVVRPNVDTYYNLVYADLENNPLYIHIPATERYYLIPILNAYGDVIESLGSRTTGQGAIDIALVGPNYNDILPKDMTVIRSNTNMNWLLGRVQVNDDEDGKDEVKNFHDKIVVRPLGEYKNKNYVAPKGTFTKKNNIVPMDKVDDMSAEDYFNNMMTLMVANPPQKDDALFMQQLRQVGIRPGGKFDLSTFSDEEQAAIKNIPAQVQKMFAAQTAKPDLSLVQNGWFVVTKGLGEYGIDYALRAYVTKVGFGANQAKDAIYPNSAVDVEGQNYNGSNNYVLHFDADKLPPVRGFWSITAYDKKGFLIDNEIDRYNLSNKKDLVYNEDGSLDIYIQAKAPKGHEANWLPTTQAGEEFELTFRMYWPKETVLNRTWVMPGVKKVSK